jgi:hypothetical protein
VACNPIRKYLAALLLVRCVALMTGSEASSVSRTEPIDRAPPRMAIHVVRLCRCMKMEGSVAAMGAFDTYDASARYPGCGRVQQVGGCRIACLEGEAPVTRLLIREAGPP